jgi:D-methionine transport system substrate-binding protein
MKKAFALVLAAAVLVFLPGCSKSGGQADGGARSANGRTTLKIIADLVPHSELLEFVRPDLAAQGIDIEVILADDTLSNERVANGEADANFLQHEPYMLSQIAEQGYDLVNAGNIHVEPIGAYSTRWRSIAEIPDGAKIAIPNDATNEFRALTILAQNGFIRLKPDTEVFNTSILDVAEYLKPVQLIELESGLVVRTRDQFDVYITNTNRVLEAGIDTGGVLFREGADSPYANIITVKTARKNEPAIRALVAALTTERVREFINSKYQGAVVPAF